MVWDDGISDGAISAQHVEVIQISDLFETVLNDLALDWIAYSEVTMNRLEEMLKKLGAIVQVRDCPETPFILFEVLVSALKVHGYSFGDMTILEDKLS